MTPAAAWFNKQKLIRMNMPVKEDGSVHFTTTLFALIRESLSIKMGKADDMDKNDEELRAIVSKLWAIPAKKLLHLLVPPNEGTSSLSSSSPSSVVASSPNHLATESRTQKILIS